MNRAVDKLRYLSQSTPLEKQITFNDLQNRPTGFQTAIPRDPVAVQMDSLEFKNMEGMMYEAAASSSKQIRQEEMREAMVDEAAAVHGMPHQYVQAATFPLGQGLAQEQMNTAQAFHQQWAAQASGTMAQQQAQMLQAQFGAEQAANMHAAQIGQAPLPQPSMYGGVSLLDAGMNPSIPRPVPLTPQQVMAGQFAFGGDGAPPLMTVGPTWTGWAQGQAGTAQANQNRVMLPNYVGFCQRESCVGRFWTNGIADATWFS